MAPSTTQAPGPRPEREPSLTSRRQTPAIIHFAVLTAFIVPVALLPYLITKRRLNSLQRKVKDLKIETATLQNVLNDSLSSSGATTDELRRISAMVQRMRKELDRVHHDSKGMDRALAESNSFVHNELQKLAEERQHIQAQSTVLKALGTSLADIAAFMHEMELQQGLESHGKDRRGVERLRQLALRMQTSLDKHH